MKPRPVRRILSRLMLLVLLASLVPTLALVTVSLHLGARAQEDMERRVDATLNQAINLEKTLIDATIARMRDRAVSLAAHPDLIATLSPEPTDSPPAQARLAWAKSAYPDSDLITLVDRHGRAVARLTSTSRGDKLTYGGLITQVVETGAPAGAVERISREELVGEGRNLLSAVRMPVLPTDLATEPRVGTDLEDALALVGVAPVIDEQGRILGAVIVGDILNNDFRIVDEVSRQAPLGLPTNATIALDAIRVTTNVPAAGGGRRALGTQYSDPVMARLRVGEEYRGRALVGGWQWQRTIYIPLADHAGRVVAGAYVGVAEESFTSLTVAAAASTRAGVAVALVSLALAVALAYLLAKTQILQPLQRFGAEMARMAGAARGVVAALGSGAVQSAEHATEAAEAVTDALTSAEELSVGARHAAERLRELESALVRVRYGAEEQARTVAHVGQLSGDVAQAVKASRERADAVLGPARRAMLLATQGRQSALRAVTALELLGMAADPSRASAELEQTAAVAREVDDALREIARSAEEAVDRLWSLAAVLNENGARVGAITQQISDVSGVVSETQEATLAMGLASRAIGESINRLEADTDQSTDRFLLARDHLTRITTANQHLQDLSGRIAALAVELEQLSASFPDR